VGRGAPEPASTRYIRRRAPIAQLAEAADLKSVQCRFESDWGHPGFWRVYLYIWVSLQTQGQESVSWRAEFTGWSVAETLVLDRYRLRAL
jgi:hypothetical protein